jgi:hypothetical protein
MGDYKLYRLYGLNSDATDAFELYNIINDLSETNNLTEKHPEIRDSLKVILNDWLIETGALVPKPNPNWKFASIGTNALKNHI